MRFESIWVVGVGGIGSHVGFKLARANRAELTLVDGWAAHVAAINEGGLLLKTQLGDQLVRGRAIHYDEVRSGNIRAPDLVFFATKSQDTVAVAKTIAPALAPGTVVTSLQNGLNLETLSDLIGARRIVGGAVLIDGFLEGPGVVRQIRADDRVGRNGFAIGELDGGISPRLLEIKELLDDVALTRTTDNIRGELLIKFIHTCLINAVCAITGKSTGEAMQIEPVREVSLALTREAIQFVLTRYGDVVLPPMFGRPVEDWLVTPPSPELHATVTDRIPATDRIIASMLQDVLKGRPTEIDSMNGLVAAGSATLGLEAPLSRGVTAIIRRLEQDELHPGKGELAGSTWAERLLETVSRRD